MKKLTSMLLAILIGCSFSLSAFAQDSTSAAGYEKEVVIEVDSEEEFLNYPKNPNVKYTFIIQSPSKSRAVCYMCGKATLGTVSAKNETGTNLRQCPTTITTNNLDVFMTWQVESYERCTACGYRSEAWLSPNKTYTADCINGNTPSHGGSWVVKREYTMAAGYDIHQSLRYWQNGYEG